MSLILRRASLLVFSLVPTALAGCPAGDAVSDGGSQNDAGGAGSGSTSSSATTGSGAGSGTGGSGLGAILVKATFEEMFPNKNALFSYEAFLSAASAFPAFVSDGSVDVQKRELAAFLANISHETTGGWATAPGGPEAWGLYFTQEVGCEKGACTGYCVPDAKYPCAAGKTYHGRGPIQLSYNFNYGPAGEAIEVDLLNNPDLVTSDGLIAWKTGLWFWMTPQAPKPSSHDVMTGAWKPSAADTAAGRTPGFGMTVNIINGGIECQKATPPQVADRVAFYKRYTGMLMVSTGSDLYCDQMTHY
jgi:basic endochitinase B